MNCDQVQDLLPEYVDHQVKQVYLVEIEEHLSTCAGCRLLHGIYKRNVQILGSFPEVAPPPDLVERILQRTSRPAGLRTFLERYFRVPAPVLLTAGAMILLALVGPTFLQLDTPISRDANKYLHRAWSYSQRVYGRAEGMGQEIATFKNIFFLLLDRKVEKIQQELETYRKQKNEQQSSQSVYYLAEGDGSGTQGASSHVLRKSPNS